MATEPDSNDNASRQLKDTLILPEPQSSACSAIAKTGFGAIAACQTMDENGKLVCWDSRAKRLARSRRAGNFKALHNTLQVPSKAASTQLVTT